MRIFVLVFTLIGGLACAAAGLFLKSGLPSDATNLSFPLLVEMVKKGVPPEDGLQRLLFLAYSLLAAFPLAVLGGMLGLIGRKWWAAGALLLGAVGPLYLVPQLTFLSLKPLIGLAASAGLLVVGGLLCLFLPSPPTSKEPTQEAPTLRRREWSSPRQGSPTVIVLAFLLFVGVATSFSVLTALGVLRLGSGQEERSGRADRDPVDDHEDGEKVPKQQDEPPDPEELSRQAAERQARLEKHQAREKQLLARLRTAQAREAGTALWRVKVDGTTVEQVAFSPDGTTLATVAGKSIRLWDIDSGKSRHTLTGHTARIRGFAFSPDGRLLASGADDKSLRLWNVATGEAVFGFTLDDTVACVVFSPDGKLVLAGTDGKRGRGQIKIWEVDSARSLPVETAKESPAVRSLVSSPDGNSLLAGDGRSDVTVYRLPQQQARDFAVPGKAEVDDVGELGSGDGRALKRRRVIQCNGDTSKMAIQPDGQALAVPSRSGDGVTVRLLDPHTGATLRTFPKTVKEIDRLTFSPDGKLLAAKVGGGAGESIQVWDVASGKRLPTRTGLSGGKVGALAFSPGGTFLAVSVGDEVRLWAVADLLSQQ